MQGLGELEALVMDVVWNTSAAVRVRDVIDQLEDGREPAYTTIQTVLDNLHRKGWVHRQRNGRAYWYEATRSREEAPCEDFSTRPATRRACCCTSPAALPMTNRRCSPAV